MQLRAVRDGMISGRAVNTPGHHEMAHSSGTGSGFVMVPRTWQPTMTFFCQLQGILYRDGLRDHTHLHRPVSGVGNGVVGFKDASVGVGEIGMKARAGFGFNETFSYGSHPESPHQFVAV